MATDLIGNELNVGDNVVISIASVQQRARITKLNRKTCNVQFTHLCDKVMGQYLANWVLLIGFDINKDPSIGTPQLIELIGDNPNWSVYTDNSLFYKLAPTDQMYKRMTDLNDIWSKADPTEYLLSHVLMLIDATLPAFVRNNAKGYNYIVQSYTDYVKSVIAQARRTNVHFHRVVKI